MKSTNVPFDDADMNDMVGLFDLAVKSGGLQVAPAALRILGKMQAAAQAAAAPDAPANAPAQDAPKPPVSPNKPAA
ncbi:MAG: hypothetical protein ACR652_00405 [Methylocystis sp.]|uniref:hypothetical protein n=1 Tax=Methylocystis sp. TaxID=1911079 RepID=UPI003DA6274D